LIFDEADDIAYLHMKLGSTFKFPFQ